MIKLDIIRFILIAAFTTTIILDWVLLEQFQTHRNSSYIIVHYLSCTNVIVIVSVIVRTNNAFRDPTWDVFVTCTETRLGEGVKDVLSRVLKNNNIIITAARLRADGFDKSPKTISERPWNRQLFPFIDVDDGFQNTRGTVERVSQQTVLYNNNNNLIRFYNIYILDLYCGVWYLSFVYLYTKVCRRARRRVKVEGSG